MNGDGNMKGPHFREGKEKRSRKARTAAMTPIVPKNESDCYINGIRTEGLGWVYFPILGIALRAEDSGKRDPVPDL